MTPEIEALWERALRTLRTAKAVAADDPDSAASRAYYAAYFAVSALFAFEDRTFRKHSALEAAVHRDLVKAGRWPMEVGAAFSNLAQTRSTADYGAIAHITVDEANAAITKAKRVLESVRNISPQPLRPLAGPGETGQ